MCRFNYVYVGGGSVDVCVTLKEESWAFVGPLANLTVRLPVSYNSLVTSNIDKH